MELLPSRSIASASVLLLPTPYVSTESSSSSQYDCWSASSQRATNTSPTINATPVRPARSKRRPWLPAFMRRRSRLALEQGQRIRLRLLQLAQRTRAEARRSAFAIAEPAHVADREH